MNSDVEYLLEKLSNQSGTNQCVVSLNERCNKILREDYFPDENGKLVFHAKTEWVDEGYSVAEMLELLQKYGDRVNEVLFETWNGEIHNLINIFEVDNIGVVGEYNCLMIVGKAGEPLKLYNNPDNCNWITSDNIYHRDHNF